MSRPQKKLCRKGAVMTEVSLVVSDVDGTVVTPDKQLTDAAVRAVELLRGEGIDFTVNSSRPPIGLRMLIEPLSLKLPMALSAAARLSDPVLT
jgi:hydroxymethylpyrimidine pyrophosphatase-like HAD family hydrolase